MKCSEDTTTAALDLEGLSDEVTLSGCFEFHLRTRSFDFPQSSSKNKLSKLANLLRSRSDGNVRSSHSSSHSSSTTGNSPKSSPRSSPHASPGPPTRRRFVRVVRDSADANLENPHVIHRYSSEYQSNLQKSMSVEEHQIRPPPYTVTGHTILKKQPLACGTAWSTSVEVVPELSPTLFPKHASFLDEVEVMEYDKKEKIRRGVLAKRRVRLHDSPAGSAEEEDSEGVDTSAEMEEGNRKKKATISDTANLADSIDVPSKHSEFDNIFTPVTLPPESLKSSRLSEACGDGSAYANPSKLLSHKPSDAGHSITTSDPVRESLEKLSVHNSSIEQPSNSCRN